MAVWIIPCNPKNYDVVGAFKKLDQIDWKQSMKNIEKDDTVYIYVSSPYQRLMYRCSVVKTNLLSIEIDDFEFVKDGTPYLNYGTHMRLKKQRILKEIGLDIGSLRKNGLRGNVQGPMRISGELLDYIEKKEKD